MDDPSYMGISKEVWNEIGDMIVNQLLIRMKRWPFAIWCLSNCSRQPISKAMKKIAELSNGRPKAAPTKSFVRMYGKLRADHADEDSPKACANIDCIRLGITYDDVEA